MNQSLKENYIDRAETRDKILPNLSLRQQILSFLAASVLKLLYLTVRYKEEYREEIDWPALQPTVFAFWHGEQLLMPLMWSKVRKRTSIKTVYMLSSQHGDGLIAAKAVSYFGVKNIFGSRSSGGREAMNALADVLKNGNMVGITPDGSKGPLHVAKPGVLRIAQLAGAGILPLHGHVNRAIRLKSWDKMCLPLPFSTVTIVFGSLIGKEKISFEKEFDPLLSYVQSELLALQTPKTPHPQHQ